MLQAIVFSPGLHPWRKTIRPCPECGYSQECHPNCPLGTEAREPRDYYCDPDYTQEYEGPIDEPCPY